MKFSGKIVVFISVLLVTSHCIDPISFPIPATDEKIVIYGQLSDLPEPQYVIVQRSTIDNFDPAPITNATVALVDEVGNRYSYQQQKPGKYILQGLTNGQPGVSYSIEVKVGDVTYRSEPERMPEVVGSDSLYYEISEESYLSKEGSEYLHRLSVFAKSELPTKKDYYMRWETNEVYFHNLTFFPNPFNTPPPNCLGEDRVDAQRINLLSGAQFKGDLLEQKVAEREIDYTFKSRHYIIVRQLSTTKASYTYWSTVKSLLANSGSPFDIPPALISGNIRNTSDENDRSLGYFEVNRVSSKRFFLIPGFIPYYLKPYCEYDRERPLASDYPSVCSDCSKIPNYFSEIPDWF